MPRLPDETALGPRPVIRNRSAVTRYNVGQVDQAIGQLADVTFQLGAQIQERDDRQSYAQARSLFLQEQVAASSAFDNDSDYKTFVPRYTERMNKARDQAAKMIGHTGMREQFMADSDLLMTRGAFQVQSKALERETEYRGAIRTTILNNNREAYLTSDDPAVRQQLLQDSLERIDLDVSENFLDADDAVRLKTETAIDHAAAAIGMQDFEEQIRRLSNTDDPIAKLIPADRRHDMLQTAKARAEQLRRRVLADLRASDNELLSDTILAFSQGQVVSDEDWEAAQASAARLGKTEDLMVAKASSQFILLPKEQRDTILPTIQGVQAAELRKGLENANAIIDREVHRDGYAFAVRQGIVEEVELDLLDPGTIEERLQQVDYLSDHYGRPISPLTNEEADTLVLSLEKMSPEDKTGLALAFGPSEIIWQQLDKKNAGLFAMVGAIGDQEVMQSVFRGQQKIQEKLVAPIKQADYLPVFDDYVDDVYSGKDRKATLNAAIAHYAATTESEVFDSDDFEASLEAVTGGIGKINGYKVELPRGVDEDDFDDYIDNFSPESVKHFGSVWGIHDKEVARIVQEGRIVSDGANRYFVVERGTNTVLRQPDGKEFVISFDQQLFEADKKVLYDAHARRLARRR